jgi:hypothetical protein
MNAHAMERWEWEFLGRPVPPVLDEDEPDVGYARHPVTCEGQVVEVVYPMDLPMLSRHKDDGIEFAGGVTARHPIAYGDDPRRKPRMEPGSIGERV